MVGSTIANCDFGVYLAGCTDLVFYDNSFLWNGDHIWSLVRHSLPVKHIPDRRELLVGLRRRQRVLRGIAGHPRSGTASGDTWYEGVWCGVDYYPLMAPSERPTVVLDASQTEGGIETVFEFDASTTWDLEDDTFEYRWDFDGDGTWDTDWSSDPTASYQFDAAGEHNVTVEVRDPGGATSTDTVTVTIESGTVIPEFSTAIVPVAAILGPQRRHRDVWVKGRGKGQKLEAPIRAPYPLRLLSSM